MISVIETKRKKGENFESFYRRFVRRLQQSKVLISARGARFYERPENRNKRRRDALARENIRKEKEYLRKIGKLQEKTSFTPSHRANF